MVGSWVVGATGHIFLTIAGSRRSFQVQPLAHFFSLHFPCKIHWFARRVNKWPLVRETLFSYLPISNFLVLAMQPWRVFWNDTRRHTFPVWEMQRRFRDKWTPLAVSPQARRAKDTVKISGHKPFCLLIETQTLLRFSLIVNSQHNRIELSKQTWHLLWRQQKEKHTLEVRAKYLHLLLTK